MCRLPSVAMSTMHQGRGSRAPSLPTAYCLLPTAYCLLPTAYCLLPTAYRSIRSAPQLDLLAPVGGELAGVSDLKGAHTVRVIGADLGSIAGLYRVDERPVHGQVRVALARDFLALAAGK